MMTSEHAAAPPAKSESLSARELYDLNWLVNATQAAPATLAKHERPPAEADADDVALMMNAPAAAAEFLLDVQAKYALDGIPPDCEGASAQEDPLAPGAREIPMFLQAPSADHVSLNECELALRAAMEDHHEDEDDAMCVDCVDGVHAPAAMEDDDPLVAHYAPPAADDEPLAQPPGVEMPCVPSPPLAQPPAVDSPPMSGADSSRSLPAGQPVAHSHSHSHSHSCAQPPAASNDSPQQPHRLPHSEAEQQRAAAAPLSLPLMPLGPAEVQAALAAGINPLLLQQLCALQQLQALQAAQQQLGLPALGGFAPAPPFVAAQPVPPAAAGGALKTATGHPVHAPVARAPAAPGAAPAAQAHPLAMQYAQEHARTTQMAQLQAMVAMQHPHLPRPTAAEASHVIEHWRQHSDEVAALGEKRKAQVHFERRSHRHYCQGCGRSKAGHRRSEVHSKCVDPVCHCGIPRLLHPYPLPAGARCGGEWRNIVERAGSPALGLTSPSSSSPPQTVTPPAILPRPATQAPINHLTSGVPPLPHMGVPV